MNDTVAATIGRLLEAHGAELLDQPHRFEALMRDLHPDEPREVAVMVEALRAGTVARAQALGAAAGRERRRQELSRHLSDASGIAPRFAIWAVGHWVTVLTGGAAEAAARGPAAPARSRRSKAPPSIVAERDGTLADVLGAAAATGRART